MDVVKWGKIIFDFAELVGMGLGLGVSERKAFMHSSGKRANLAIGSPGRCRSPTQKGGEQ